MVHQEVNARCSASVPKYTQFSTMPFIFLDEFKLQLGNLWSSLPSVLSPSAMRAQHLFSVFATAGVALSAGTVIHYPPTSTNINNLTFALEGHGAPGIFNSSTISDALYGIYNWCNMPHVRKREYRFFPLLLASTSNELLIIHLTRDPPSDFTLEYVEVIQRHHKRTPYSSNTFFKEDVAWSCIGDGPRYGAT